MEIPARPMRYTIPRAGTSCIAARNTMSPPCRRRSAARGSRTCSPNGWPSDNNGALQLPYVTLRAALVIAAVLCMFAFAADGLGAYFTGDDLMNTYGYWSRPVSQLLKEGVLFYHAEVF